MKILEGKKLKKKADALLLAAAMMVNLFPVFCSEAYAAELPEKTQFAEKADLMQFNTNDNDGAQNPAKVYFGSNNQQWWITGSQNQNLTLFAASPLAAGKVFENNSSNKTYDVGWGCDYTSTGGSAPTEVYPNHYGASPLRTELRTLEGSKFTNAEQALMNTTTIYTNDTRNRSVYSTKEKLYLAFGDIHDDQCITVGTNNPNQLNDGLRIDRGYWGNSGNFWLRAPREEYPYDALFAFPGYYVISSNVKYAYALVPAFELNLSSVIFASAAPAAVSEGKLTLADTDGDGAFTMRYSASALGSAQVAYDYTQVNVTGVPSNTYLVAQNKDGAWAKAVSGTASVSASDMGIGSFENCSVWLESTNSSERKTYAAMASREWYDVNVTLGTGMQVQSGSLTQQVDDGQSMTNIVIKTNDGYMFPADYSVAGQNGITVTRDSDSQITVLGTPTADVSLTLPAAAQKVYGMDLSGSGTFGSVCVGYASDKVAAQEFTIKNTGNVDLTNVQVTIDGTESGNFVLTRDNTVTFIQPNGTIKVTVKPKDNLAVKEYQAQLSVSADNCNTASQTLQFTVTDHAYNDVVTPPSCTERGYTIHTCQNCGDTYTDDETDIIPHPFGEWETIQAPTCVQGGNRKHVCTVCGFEETENLNPDGHKWKDTPTVDKEPTCQNDGSQSIHCKNCDATKDSQPIPRIDHKFTNYVSNNDATCTKDGTKTAACDYGCGSTNTLPDDGGMLEHDYEWTYNNDAACEKNGTETGTCRGCGAKTTREKAGTALEHQPGDWVIDTDATETADGKKHKECTVCGKVLETEAIPATGTLGGRYKILEGADQTWKGSGSLTIKANGDFAKFTGIKVDKAVVGTPNYGAKSGSTVVTLKESYLAALPDGVHTLTFVYNDGEVSANFTVAERETQGTPAAPADSGKGGSAAVRSPQTGDNADVVLWALLLVLSALLMAFAVQIRKRETYLKHKRK